MDTAAMLSSLSPASRRLVQLMQSVNYGRVEPIPVRNGEPVLDDTAVKVIREIKFGGENGPRPESSQGDFLVKRRVLELFQQLK